MKHSEERGVLNFHRVAQLDRINQSELTSLTCEELRRQMIISRCERMPFLSFAVWESTGIQWEESDAGQAHVDFRKRP